jgi:ATP-binding cassette, subfamily C, bacterial CydD
LDRPVRPLDPRLLAHASAVRALLLGSAAIGVLSAGTTIVLAACLADLIAAYAIDQAPPNPASIPVLIAAVAVKAALAWAAEVVPRRSSLRMVDQLRNALLDRVVEQDRGWTARQRPAALVQLATTGVAGLENYAARYLPQLVISALVPAGILVFLAFQDWLSALIIGLTLPLVPLFMALVGLRTRDEADRSYRALQLLGGHFLDLIRGLPTLKVFGRSRSQADGIRRAGEDYRRATNTTLRIAFTSSMVLELLATISVALVAVSIGLRLIGGSMDLRTGLTVLLVAPEAFLALRAVGTHFHASVDGLTAADRLFTVLDAAVPEPGTRPAPAGDLRVAATLHGVPLEVTAAHRTVTLLTGASGAGKSTALSLLAALARPDDGEVTADGTSLGEVSPDAWRGAVGYLVQSPYLPAGSVADTLRALRPAATDGELASALHAAMADEVVAELPNGVDTVLSEGAAELSQGQRARLALARTLVSDRPVLLLDEPTAALDEDTEAELVRRLPPFLAGRTVVIASHRPALRALADSIVQISDARAAVAVVPDGGER